MLLPSLLLATLLSSAYSIMKRSVVGQMDQLDRVLDVLLEPPRLHHRHRNEDKELEKINKFVQVIISS